jgi:type III restriction enzyme
VDAAKGEITVVVPLDQEETDQLTRCLKTPEAKAKVEEAVMLVREAEKAFGGSGKTRTPSPYERHIDFIVPLLAVREDGQLLEFESTFLLEHPWKLSAKDAGLAEDYNPLKRPAGKAGLVDVGAKGEVETQVMHDAPGADFAATLHQQVLALGGAGDWSQDALVGWLDKAIDHQDIPMGESAEFLRKVIRGLMAKFGISDVSVLAPDRHRLRDQVEERIKQHRQSERRTAYQSFLVPDAPLAVSEEFAINFRNISYEPSWLYQGGFRFKNHYFGPKPGELTETTTTGELKEEFQCAQFLDDFPQVKFWLRNLPRKPTSFRLQTSTDWFYPDFICQLNDSRILAVEYKGKHLYDSPDAEEKRAVGAVWQSRSGGKCLFVMPTDGKFSQIIEAVRPA